MESTDVYVSEDEAYAEIRVNRTSGVEQFAAVYAATGGDKAIAGEHDRNTKRAGLFTGRYRGDVRIPILPNEDRGERGCFMWDWKQKAVRSQKTRKWLRYRS